MGAYLDSEDARLRPLREYHEQLRATRMAAEAAEAAKRAAAERAAAERAAAERVAAELAAAQLAEMQRMTVVAEMTRRRGIYGTSSLRDSTWEFMDSGWTADACLALGASISGSSTILRCLSSGWVHSGGLPRGLHNALNGRSRSLAPPVLCALSSSEPEHFFIMFADGKYKHMLPRAAVAEIDAQWSKGGSLSIITLGAPGVYYLQFSDGSSVWGGAERPSRGQDPLGPGVGAVARPAEPDVYPISWRAHRLGGCASRDDGGRVEACLAGLGRAPCYHRRRGRLGVPCTLQP